MPVTTHTHTPPNGKNTNYQILIYTTNVSSCFLSLVVQFQNLFLIFQIQPKKPSAHLLDANRTRPSLIMFYFCSSLYFYCFSLQKAGFSLKLVYIRVQVCRDRPAQNAKKKSERQILVEENMLIYGSILSPPPPPSPFTLRPYTQNTQHTSYSAWDDPLAPP